jgi:putative hydrolases of HD superfamily
MDFNDLERLYGRIHDLKRLTRRGWVVRGVSDPESVADHSYGVALLTLVFAREFELDLGAALSMALVHDLAESIVGDLIPADGVSTETKLRQETEAIKTILETLESDSELYELWCDFEHGRTPEGRLVRQLDRLEMAFQALAYEQDTGLSLNDFFPYVRARITDPRLIAVLDGVENRRLRR